MRKAQSGDREAFIELMKEIEIPLYQTAWSIVKHEEDCADALQETMLNAYKALHTLKEPSYFKTWIYRILINECNQLLRRRARTLPLPEIPNVPSHSDDYEKIDLWDAVDRLEEKGHRTALFSGHAVKPDWRRARYLVGSGQNPPAPGPKKIA